MTFLKLLAKITKSAFSEHGRETRRIRSTGNPTMSPFGISVIPIAISNLPGQCYTSGELRQKEGRGIFGPSSRTPSAITILVTMFAGRTGNAESTGKGTSRKEGMA